jgi:Ca2+-binding EF-hand superfamily protein
MIKKIILMGAVTTVILTSVCSCSTNQNTIPVDGILYKTTNDFKPKISFDFKKFDSNGDGQVNFTEWKKGLQLMLKEYDYDGDGSFERKEGERADFDWMLSANKNDDDVISPSEVNEGLKTIFTEASGTNSLISKREFRNFSWVTGESYGRRKK